MTAAKYERDEAERELRYFFYLDSLTISEVIHTFNFYAALQRAAMQVRRWVLGCCNGGSEKRVGVFSLNPRTLGLVCSPLGPRPRSYLYIPLHPPTYMYIPLHQYTLV